MRLYKATATDADNVIFTLALALCALQHQAKISSYLCNYLASATVVSEHQSQNQAEGGGPIPGIFVSPGQ